MIDQRAIDIIKKAEGLRLTSYRCPAGIPTVGYGCTGPDIVDGLTWTKTQAEERLAKDLEKFASGVAKICPTATPLQMGAMVSLAYNIGLGAFKSSTVARMHNEGNHEGAARAFHMWNKAGGKVQNGLIARRAEEAELYTLGSQPDYSKVGS